MRAILIGVAFGSLLALVGCKPATAPTAASDARPKVALVMKSLANDFFSTMAAGARDHQAAHAADYDLLVSGIKNETDLTEQVNLVEPAVAQGAKAIVIAPADSKALVPALRRAQQAGVVIVNIDNRLDADVARQAGLAAAFVGVRLAFVLAYLGGKPTVRTLLWNLGFAINIAIFFMPMWGPRIGG